MEALEGLVFLYDNAEFFGYNIERKGTSINGTEIR